MRTVAFMPAARFEMYEAADWYENESSGLGERFLLDVDATVARIAESALQFPLVYKHVRRALLVGFPYLLMYVIEDDENLSIVSCFHGSRDTVRWHERI